MPGAPYGVTEYSYDRRGLARCTAVRMNPAEFALPAYDACLQRGTDAARVADRITQNFHDAAGQLVEAWDGVGTPLQRREALYTYDGDGRKTSGTRLRKRDGSILAYPYDAANRMSPLPPAAADIGSGRRQRSSRKRVVLIIRGSRISVFL